MNKVNEKVGGFFSEFKKFALKGNVIDLAVGVIIGGAFGKITTSLVNDVLMPLIGILLGGINFTTLSFTLPSFWNGNEPVIVYYGSFINSIVDFLIIAFCVFLIIKAMNRLTRKNEAPPPEPPSEPSSEELLAEIRDLLKANIDK